MSKITADQIKQTIKTEVNRLGFVLNGFTTPEPIQNFEQYQSWIDSGYHADMDYLSRASSIEKRKNPTLVFPAVQSILVLGIPYQPTFSTEQYGIAAYAQGPDYHDLIPQRLSGFQAWLESLVGHTVQMKIYVDTAPIMEKELAVRAGLGWVGKNGLLINPVYGSYFFLAEIFLDLVIPPDEPFTKDFCGNCTRCTKNCPTDCILPHRTLDTNRCLSYLTIEKKGKFTSEQESAINKSIFGCDVCQDVCPWNQKLAENPINSYLFSPEETLSKLEFEEILCLDENNFRDKFRKTPVFRTKRAGLLRNLLASVSKFGSQQDLAIIQLFIEQEENENLRMIAAHAQELLLKKLVIENLDESD